MDFDYVAKLREGDHLMGAELEDRNIIHENVLLRTRHFLEYRDFYDSIRAGDIGKVDHYLELFCAQFVGGKQHRYASGLMEHLCGVREGYSDELIELIRKNWLIDPYNGHGGNFLSLDEFMKELVRLLKLIYNSGGPHTAETYTREHVAHVIITLLQIKRKMRLGLMGKEFGGYHARSKRAADVSKLLIKQVGLDMYRLKKGRGTNDEYAVLTSAYY